ncbi:MAG: hypothetical protein ACE15B_09525 [Bryobacteraceae bacterium]
MKRDPWSDLADELTLIINYALLAWQSLDRGHPARREIAGLQRSAMRCAAIARQAAEGE